MAMTSKRLNEVARTILEERYFTDGLKLSQNTFRELSAQAAQMSLSSDELEECVRDMLPRLLGRVFGYEYVSISWFGRKPRRLKNVRPTTDAEQ